jgi:acetylornithine deacetylase/succinyl-diaminopimelate desuccinylase-like protein
MPEWTHYLETQSDRFLSELLDFLRIPSVSALPAHAGDVQRAAEWISARMQAAGIEAVQILPTGGHPVVYGEWLHAPGQPTVLIYGHFDVQPADPLEKWQTPPFEPRVEDGRVYARGASDDKGNLLPPVLAVEALLQTEGSLPLNVKFLYEGQEEIGSPQLDDFVNAQRELLACDLVLSADGGQWSEHKPLLLTSLRGGCGLQIDLQGPRRDLHSGMHGGAIQNPIHALVRLLDSMRSPAGEILVDGFYDDVLPLSEADGERIAAIPHDDAEYVAGLGIDATFGEPGYGTLERQWARPTLEVNGIWGGFQGEGVKTVIPTTAHAKITCRLVANQEPRRIVAALKAHVDGHLPPGVSATVIDAGFSAKPYLIPADHPGNRAAHAVLEKLYGKAPYYIRMGGSIPICAMLLDHLGADTVSFGFALGDEGFHGPNEFFRLSSFARSQQAYVRILERLARPA